MAQTLGPYTLGQPLGTLPFGELIEATHAARREPLALLILPDGLARDHRLRGLLRLEIARAGGLRHPAIARPIEVAEHDGRLYVVYERPASEPLSRWIDDQRNLTAATAVSLVRSLADGLDAAHGRRLAHGSIRPGVLLVRPDQGLVLIGVGVLAAIDEAGLADGCRPGLNPAYSAPEQQTGKLAVPSADAFACGALARTLLAAASDSVPGHLQPGIQAVLDRQAGAEPSARFRTAGEFARALSDALAPASADPPTSAPSSRPLTSPSISTSSPRLEPGPARRNPPTASRHPTERLTSTPASPARAPAASFLASPRTRLPLAPGAWRQDGRSRVRSLPETPAIGDAVHAAGSQALSHALLVAAGPLLLLILIPILGNVFLVLPAILLIVALGVPQAIQRARRLRQAQINPDVVQALGPARVVEEHMIGALPYPRSHRLGIGEVDVLTISGAAFSAISAVGTHMHVELDEEGKVPPHDFVYDLTALATYSRTGDYLLEIRRANGDLIYLASEYVGTDADEVSGPDA